MAPKWASPPHCSEAAHLKMKSPGDRVCIARVWEFPPTPTAHPITQKRRSSTKSTACQALETTPAKVHSTQTASQVAAPPCLLQRSTVGDCGAKWMNSLGPRVFSRGSYTISLSLPMILYFSVSLLPLLLSFTISFQGQVLSRWV